jgi:hypothetical protein
VPLAYASLGPPQQVADDAIAQRYARPSFLAIGLKRKLDEQSQPRDVDTY